MRTLQVIDLDVSEAISHQGFYIGDNFLAPEPYSQLQTAIKLAQDNGQFRKAKIGQHQQKNTNVTIRNDHISWLENASEHNGLDAYFAAVETIRQELNRSLFLGLINYEAHFAIYSPGTFYKKHIDQFSTTKDRRISCVYYLNNKWQPEFGGELSLYDETERELIKIAPLGNRFICFNSDILHEVHPTLETRFSIAGWLKTRPLTPT